MHPIHRQTGMQCAHMGLTRCSSIGSRLWDASRAAATTGFLIPVRAPFQLCHTCVCPLGPRW